tara:strand:+ start:1706 stop:2107 length:402 start_codon:yes stop_codon:yes gene_type:complete
MKTTQEKFFAEVNRLKGKTNLKAHKVALGSMDDMLGRANNILQEAETKMPNILSNWHTAIEAVEVAVADIDDFGIDVSYEARTLEEDLDILAMRIEDLGLSPSDVDAYQDVIQIINKLHTIQNEAHSEIGSGM